MNFKDVNELTPEQIQELKNQYGPMFKVTVADCAYLCRKLYDQDWKIITRLSEDNPKIAASEVDEKIVNLALIGPKPDIAAGWSAKPAGVIPTLSVMIRAKSGFMVQGVDSDIFVEDIGEEEAEPVKPTPEEKKTLKDGTALELKGVGIGSDYFVVRQITRVEFKAIVQSFESQTEQDKQITEKAVMWPKGVNWDNKGAGYCDTISQIVLALSGFNGPSLVEDI